MFAARAGAFRGAPAGPQNILLQGGEIRGQGGDVGCHPAGGRRAVHVEADAFIIAQGEAGFRPGPMSAVKNAQGHIARGEGHVIPGRKGAFEPAVGAEIDLQRVPLFPAFPETGGLQMQQHGRYAVEKGIAGDGAGALRAIESMGERPAGEPVYNGNAGHGGRPPSEN